MTTAGAASIIKTDSAGNTFSIAELSQLSGDGIFVLAEDLDFGEPQFYKEITAVQVEMTEAGNLDNVEFLLGWKERLKDATTWESAQSLSGADTVLFYRISGRFFDFKLRDTAPQVQWQFNRIIFYGTILNRESGRGPRGRF